MAMAHALDGLPAPSVRFPAIRCRELAERMSSQLGRAFSRRRHYTGRDAVVLVNYDRKQQSRFGPRLARRLLSRCEAVHPRSARTGYHSSTGHPNLRLNSSMMLVSSTWLKS